MNKILLIVAFFFLNGCVIAQHKPLQENSQTKMTALEKTLQDKDQEIQTLQDQVDELNHQFKDQREGLAVGRQDQKKTTPVVFNNPKDPEFLAPHPQELIRVDASPQDVQLALKNAGYYDGAVDGKLGPRSQKAITDFQMDHDLESDGIVGRQTWLKLKTYLDKPAETVSDSSVPSQEY